MNKQLKYKILSLVFTGADPNTKNQITSMPLIHVTAKIGNLGELEMLLGEAKTDVNVKDNEGRTILHRWARVSEKNPDDKEKLEKCFKCIVQKGFNTNRSFKDKDSSESTTFSTAVGCENSGRVVQMLDTDINYAEWAHIREVLESANESFVKSILDYCFESNDEPVNSKDLEVKFKIFAILNMIHYVIVSPHKELLKHPVLSAFISLSWKRLKYFFFLQCCFLLFVFGFPDGIQSVFGIL